MEVSWSQNGVRIAGANLQHTTIPDNVIVRNALARMRENNVGEKESSKVIRIIVKINQLPSKHGVKSIPTIGESTERRIQSMPIAIVKKRANE